MSELSSSLIAVGLSLCLSGVVLRVLNRPLFHVLRRLCPDAVAADFWLVYSQIMLTVAPLLTTLLAAMVGPDLPLLPALRLALVAALLGLLIGLWTLGRRLVQSVARAVQGEPS
ncbi:MAG: hypothetical protein JOY84_05080 [Curvibacter sp.]|nr:hypothetical protein [Curvibacter sp.]